MPRLTDIDETMLWTPFDDCPTEQIDLTINIALQSRVTGSTLLLYRTLSSWDDSINQPITETTKEVFTFKSITLVPDYDLIESGDVD
jgi:hypothetical protein